MVLMIQTINEVDFLYSREWSFIITSPDQIQETLLLLEPEDLQPTEHEVVLTLLRNI